MPGAARVAVFWDQFSRGQLDKLASAAGVLGIELKCIELSGNLDFEAAFALAQQRKCAAALMLLSPRFLLDNPT